MKKHLLVILGSFLIIYLIIAFITMSINAEEWHWSGRLILIVSYGAFLISVYDKEFLK
jgi:hypothetical protein